MRLPRFSRSRGLFSYRRTVGKILAMGKALEKAISEASKLPEKEQEAIGAWLLAEIESDRRWDELFSESGAVLEGMADQALDEHKQGLTKPLDPNRL